MAKKVTTTIASREELEQVAGEYAEAIIDRDKLLANLDAKINALRKESEASIAACTETADGLFSDMQAWAVLHPQEFAKSKSIDLLHAVLGLRTSPPAVKQMRGVKADHSISALSAAHRADFIRVKREIDKEAILGAYTADKGVADLIKQFGLCIDQDESFYVTVKKESTNA